MEETDRTQTRTAKTLPNLASLVSMSLGHVCLVWGIPTTSSQILPISLRHAAMHGTRIQVMDQIATIKRWLLRHRLPSPRWPRKRRDALVETTPGRKAYMIPTRSKVPRERALTIVETSRELATHDQMQSLLFTKLPLELRYMIYREVL